MISTLLNMAVNTGDNGSQIKYIIIGVVCVVAIAAVIVLGKINKKEDDEDEEK